MDTYKTLHVWRIALRRFSSPLLVALFAATFAASPARAADVNHFEVSDGPHNFLVTSRPYVLEHLSPSAWVVGSYAHDSLVCRDANGQEIHKVVEHAGTGAAGASIGLFDWVELGAVVPGSFVNGPTFQDVPGRCAGFDGQGLSAFNLNDPRLVGKVSFTPWREGLVAAGKVTVGIPFAQPISRLVFNNTQGQFFGEEWGSIRPSLLGGFSSKWFTIGAELGYLLRKPTTLGDLLVGNEITYSVGAEVALYPGWAYITGDVYGRAAPSFGPALELLFSNRNQFPLEGVLGLKGFIGPVALVAGAGTGFVPHYGVPDVRVFAGIGYYARPEEKEPEPPPPPPRKKKKKKKKKKKAVRGDRDSDGLFDDEDECPDAPEDIDGFEDEDGCPDIDNDKDGVLDRDDGCMNEPEDIDRWQDSDGCPDPDNDEDTILDDDDDCPNDPEVFNEFEDTDGCPDSKPTDKKRVLVVVKREKIEILEKVYFAYDSDRILPKSYDLLDDVAAVVIKHKEIPKVLVEGHTDSDGSERYNLDLSDRRARSVRAYLVAAGVVEERLDARGFGEEQPIAKNETKAGKAKNRRVEFRIIRPEGVKSTVFTEDEAPEGEADDDAAEGNPSSGEDTGTADEGGDAEADDGSRRGAVPGDDDESAGSGDDEDDLFVD